MNNAEQDNLDQSLYSRQIETWQEKESITGTTNRLLLYNFILVHCYLDTDQTQSSIFDLLPDSFQGLQPTDISSSGKSFSLNVPSPKESSPDIHADAALLGKPKRSAC